MTSVTITSNPKPILAIVISHPIQYFVPVYRLLASSSRIDVTVVYLSDHGVPAGYDPGFSANVAWDIDLTSGYKHVFLRPGYDVAGKSFWQIRSAALSNALDSINPDVVLLNGYGQLLQWSAWLWAWRHRRRTLYFSDSNILNTLEGSALKKLVKGAVVRFFMRRIDVFLSIGARNREYLESCNVNNRKIVRCPYAIDISRFKIVLQTTKLQHRHQLVEQYSIEPDTVILLFVGKLIVRKRPDDLVSAVIRLRQLGHKVTALLVGTGSLYAELKSHAEAAGAAGWVRFAGFVNQANLPQVYAGADILVISSENEAFGLVTTEAAACGLPIVASHKIGSATPTDVVQHGRNGIVYQCGNVDELTHALQTLIGSEETRRRFGTESLRIADTQDITVAATAIDHAVKQAI